jgi:hypothetical protein
VDDWDFIRILAAMVGRGVLKGFEYFWRAMGTRAGVQEVEIHGGGFPRGWAWKSKHSINLTILPVVQIVKPAYSIPERVFTRAEFEDHGFEMQKLR